MDRKPDPASPSASPSPRKGWLVAFAGTGVNLSLGILYSWSLIAAYLRAEQGWTAMNAQLPYMIACGVFAILMVPGGRIQDRIGPRKVIMAAAVFAGVGLTGSGFFIGVVSLSLFFGIFFGTAMGLGYSSATPPALKWFGPERRGLIAGVVVSGFGLASVYTAPLTNYLLSNFGLSSTFLVLGISFFVLIMLLAQLIDNPPDGYRVNGVAPAAPPIIDGARANKCSEEEFEWYEMVRTPQFYLLWLTFCFGSLAGLMVIGQLSSIVFEQSGYSLGFILVAILAVFNALGRISGGLMFDRLGQTSTLVIILAIQALNFLFFGTFSSLTMLVIGAMVAGFCYGACLSVFPSTTALLYGVKNLGVNYGLVFTSWGAGGVFGGLLGGTVRDLTGSYNTAFLIASSLCFIGIILTLLIKAPVKSCD
jgi:MFS transporter, OFA family, oxalate/formate antiporter